MLKTVFFFFAISFVIVRNNVRNLVSVQESTWWVGFVLDSSMKIHLHHPLVFVFYSLDVNDNSIIHDVSIKLVTNWHDIYTMIDSEKYISMKKFVQSSVC